VLPLPHRTGHLCVSFFHTWHKAFYSFLNPTGSSPASLSVCICVHVSFACAFLRISQQERNRKLIRLSKVAQSLHVAASSLNHLQIWMALGAKTQWHVKALRTANRKCSSLVSRRGDEPALGILGRRCRFIGEIAETDRLLLVDKHRGRKEDK
jgi:hypothetical protein